MPGGGTADGSEAASRRAAAFAAGAQAQLRQDQLWTLLDPEAGGVGEVRARERERASCCRVAAERYSGTRRL
eukprot:3067520-Prymnesium_polylepis.1